MQRVPAVAPNAVAPAGLPTRADIEEWTDAITDLSTAAAEYRQCAQGVDAVADAHCQSLSAPGGTEWDGDSADAAREAAYGDRGIIWRATDHMRNGLARAADAGAQDIHAARSRVQDAIELAERDGYTVGNDLSVVDNNTYTVASDYDARQAKALEHREEITRLAVALVAEDSQVGEKLSTEAAALDAIIPASWGAGRLPAEAPRFDAVDNEVDEPHAQFGSEVQQEVPPNRFIDDQRFGHWESVVAPPYVGDQPPPLSSQYDHYPSVMIGQSWAVRLACTHRENTGSRMHRHRTLSTERNTSFVLSAKKRQPTLGWSMTTACGSRNAGYRMCTNINVIPK